MNGPSQHKRWPVVWNETNGEKNKKKRKAEWEKHDDSRNMCIPPHTHTHTGAGEFGRKEEKKGNDPHNIRFGFNPLRLFPPLSPYWCMCTPLIVIHIAHTLFYYTANTDTQVDAIKKEMEERQMFYSVLFFWGGMKQNGEHFRCSFADTNNHRFHLYLLLYLENCCRWRER